jgi:hypothetical protein
LIEKALGYRPELGDSEEARQEKLIMESAKRWEVITNHYAHLYGTCKDLKCLPRAGGLDDQDWIVVEAFSIIGAEMKLLEARAYQNQGK